MRRFGHVLRWLPLPAGFPLPSAGTLVETGRLLESLPDRSIFLTDLLVSSTAPGTMARQRDRLAVVPIVHHPLVPEGRAADPASVRPEELSLACATPVTCTSEVIAAMLRQDYRVPAPGLAQGSSCGPCLLAAGAVVVRKGHERLVAALAVLANRPRQLTIAGNLARAPDCVRALRSAIAEAGLGGRIELVGERDEAALEHSRARADLSVSASFFEGHGMALAEALAHGPPVVATAAGAPAAWLGSAAAEVAANNSIGSFAPALAAVRDDPERRAQMRSAARAARLRLPSGDDCARTVVCAVYRLKREPAA